jgi:hypothetical protein
VGFTLRNIKKRLFGRYEREVLSVIPNTNKKQVSRPGGLQCCQKDVLLLYYSLFTVAKEQACCHRNQSYAVCALLPVGRPALYYHNLSQAALRLKLVGTSATKWGVKGGHECSVS